MNFIHFSGYKNKIKLVSILRKREDQALIWISTILKFSALVGFYLEAVWIAQDGASCRSRLLFFIIIILGKRFELQTSDLLLERGTKVGKGKDVMQGKLFQKCTHLLYCSALSLGGNVNTRRMLQPDMGSIFHIKKINEIFWS